MLSPAEDAELRECYFHPAATFLGAPGPTPGVVPTLLGQLSFAQLGGHIDGQINGQINGQLDGRPLNGRLNGQLSGRINGQLTGQLTGTLPLQSLPTNIPGAEHQPQPAQQPSQQPPQQPPQQPVTMSEQPTINTLYSSHLNHHRTPQGIMTEMPDHHMHHLQSQQQSIRADSISQMQLLLERSRSALDRIDLHLPGSPDCESQLNDEFAFRSPRGHKDGSCRQFQTTKS